jgi:cation diffusion facilitator CzcD-associated flavoprotein CzcO
MSEADEQVPTAGREYDAIVVGAGFGGLRALRELRDVLGMSVRVLEAGTDVGGTWYWNRYPGARTDTESWAYCFSFDEQLQQDWDWPERFPTQQHVLEYLRHVADRFDMRKDIQCSARVTAAVYDEERNRWTVEIEGGERFTSTYLVCASGVLSVTYDPPFPGLETFEGEWYQTSRWPKNPVDFQGKRVAVVGTGATGVQVIPIVAHEAEHLTVFQRTPNYVMPGRNHPLTEEQRREIKRNYDAIWAQARSQVFAFPMAPAGRLSCELTTEEDLRPVFEAGWEAGGFRYLFETVDDLLVDERVNDYASEFVREKIRAIVKDPDTAEKLCPKTHPVGGKRPPLGHFYYEAFNRENVELVDVRENPISEITPTGIRLRDGSEHEADVIIFAIGFDAVTGSLTHMDLRGRGGVSIAERWRDGAATYLGMSCDGFPNLFMILGPQGPFANLPPVIEAQVEFMGGVLARMREDGAERVEATPEAVDGWSRQCQELLDATIIANGLEDRPWFLGANIPGKPVSVLFYFGGAAAYFGELARVADADFEGLSVSSLARA